MNKSSGFYKKYAAYRNHVFTDATLYNRDTKKIVKSEFKVLKPNSMSTIWFFTDVSFEKELEADALADFEYVS